MLRLSAKIVSIVRRSMSSYVNSQNIAEGGETFTDRVKIEREDRQDCVYFYLLLSHQQHFFSLCTEELSG